MTEKQLLSVEEFCREFSISRGVAFKEIKKGRLKAKKMDGGRKNLIRREDANAWMNSLENAQ